MKFRSVAVSLAWAASVLAALGLGAWAGWATFAPPQVDVEAASPVLYTIDTQKVGRSLTLPVNASWGRRPLSVGAASGTVTSVAVTNGNRVVAGDVLYAVDLRPVVVMAGATPAFRAMTSEDVGDDVHQLQEYLRDAGYLAEAQVTGRYMWPTTAAVRAWQKDVGFPVDGTVHAGDVVFADHLPARVALNSSVTVGSRLSAGQVVAYRLSKAPSFVIELTTDQLSVVPTSGPVEVRSGDVSWQGVIASAESESRGGVRLTLTASDGGSLCGKKCDLIPVRDSATVLEATIVTVPYAEGPTVPAAALRTHADGSAFLVTGDGQEVEVTIESQGDGRAVVQGVQAGDVVWLFGTDGAATAGTSASTGTDATSSSGSNGHTANSEAGP